MSANIVHEPEILIKLPNYAEPLEGRHSVVIIGPNGAGKTTVGVEIFKLNRPAASRIPAKRVIDVSTISHTPTDYAEQQLTQITQQHEEKPYLQIEEIAPLLATLKSEHVGNAVKYRDSALNGIADATALQKTKIEQVKESWDNLLPSREINLLANDTDSHMVSPTVKNEKAKEPYTVQQMSDGEKAVLYMLAKVFDAPAGILVIDEPETHLHAALAEKLWDELESKRPDCRFVYITHDIPFALSRRNAQFIICKDKLSLEVLEHGINNGIPVDVQQAILGARTFSLLYRVRCYL